MENLRSCAKVMVANVSSLLKTVKSVEDEAARGARALESAIDAINTQLTVGLVSCRSSVLKRYASLITLD